MARETEEDWVQLGADEPWWGVLSAPQFLSANLTEEAKEQFYQQGREEIEWALAKIRQSDPDFRPIRALDFGSGLGRLSFAMAPHCEEVLGVDVSPGMLAEAERQRVSRGFSGRFVCKLNTRRCKVQLGEQLHRLSAYIAENRIHHNRRHPGSSGKRLMD